MKNEMWIFIRRNKGFSIAVCITIILLLLCEAFSLMLNSATERGRDEGYIYNGEAILIDAQESKLSEEDYSFLSSLDHVTGVSGSFNEFIIEPVDTKNVKEHTGVKVDPVKTENSEGMVLLAWQGLKNYDLFRKEKNVHLVKGRFPEEKGVMVEKRYAELNKLDVGDRISFSHNEVTFSVEIAGIYYVDSEFRVLEENTKGGDVFLYSPYNTVYMEYAYAVDLLGIDDTRGNACSLFVDRPENVSSVADRISDYAGGRWSLYDNSTGYLERECSIIGILEGITTLLRILVFAAGSIILLIVISFIYERIKKDAGIYLVLGDSRNRVWRRSLLVFAMFCFISLLIMIVLTLVIYKPVLAELNSALFQNSVDQSEVFGVFYETPGIRNGFHIVIERSDLINAGNLLRETGLLCYSFLIASVLPTISVMKSEPKDLLYHE